MFSKPLCYDFTTVALNFLNGGVAKKIKLGAKPMRSYENWPYYKSRRSGLQCLASRSWAIEQFLNVALFLATLASHFSSGRQPAVLSYQSLMMCWRQQFLRYLLLLQLQYNACVGRNRCVRFPSIQASSPSSPHVVGHKVDPLCGFSTSQCNCLMVGS